MKKIKILQFPIASSYGGITHYALNNWFHMDKEKFICDFATMSKHLGFEDEILKTGSKVFYISCYAEDNEERFRMEFSNILDEGYDVVHLHTKQWKSYLAEEICKQKGVKKIVIHAHSTRCDNNDSTIREIETKRHFDVRNQLNESIATDFWACSQSAAEWLFGEMIPREKVKIMKNAIETDKFLFDINLRKEVRERLCISEDDFVVGNVGRLSCPKNQEFLIEMFAEAFGTISNSRLMIVGEGELHQQLEQQVEKLGISNKVIFTGKVSDVNMYYQAMDVFTLPSLFEGFPISLVEAYASGLGCVVSNAITAEVLFDDSIKELPLDVNAWSEVLLEEYKRYINGKVIRKNNKKLIDDMGFNIDEQIKVIEMEYASSYT